MTILPRTRAARIRWGILLVLLLIIIFPTRIYRLAGYTTYTPKEGDIVFQSLPHHELVDAIEGATHSPWSHCGVIMQEKGEWVVYEALGAVRTTPLNMWILRSRGFNYAIYRPKKMNESDTEKLRTGLKQFLKRPYDIHYAPDDSEIYCSELVYKAYDRALGMKIGQWQTLGSLDWKPFEPFILTIENSVPLERPMITPVELTRSDLLECVKAGSD